MGAYEVVLRGHVSGKVLTIVDKSRATRRCRYYPYTSLLFHAIQKRFWNYKCPCQKMFYSNGHDANIQRFSKAVSALSGLGNLMCHSSSPIIFQHQKVHMKSNYIQRCHGEGLRLPSSLCTHRSLPIAENKNQKCPAANTSEMSKDRLGCFSLEHNKHTPYDRFINSRVYATENFAN